MNPNFTAAFEAMPTATQPELTDIIAQLPDDLARQLDVFDHLEYSVVDMVNMIDANQANFMAYLEMVNFETVDKGEVIARADFTADINKILSVMMTVARR